MRRVILIVIGACAVGIFSVLLLLNHEPDNDSQYRVAVIMKSEDNIFWQGVWAGVRNQASSLDVEISEYPYDSLPRVADYLEICYHSGVDAIIIAVRDPSVLEESGQLIERMRQEGIVIVAVDMDIGDAWSDIYIGLDNYELGQLIVQDVLSPNQQVDRIAVIIAEETSSVNVRRLDGCMDQLEEYGLSDVSDTLVLEGEYIQQMYSLQDYLAQLDSPVLLFVINPMLTIQVANIVSNSQMADKVTIIGFGETEDALSLVGDGTINTLIMQDNYGMGATAVRSLYEILEDQPISSVTVDTVVVTEENWEDVKI